MKWEFDILYALQKIHQPVLDHIMTGLSTIGNAGIFWIVLGLALCIPKKYRKIGIQMVISMAITFIIGNLILKNLIARERPCWLDTQIALLIKKPKGLFLSVRSYGRFLCIGGRTFLWQERSVSGNRHWCWLY